MKETEFDNQLKKAIAAAYRKELKEDLRALEASLSEPKPRTPKFNWRIAASVAVFVGLGSLFFLFNQNPTSEELYNSYFSPYENVVAPIVRDQANRSKKAQAFADYEQGLYQKAIDGWDALTPQDSLDVSTLQFYKANALLKLEQFEKAKSLFEHVVDLDQEWKEESRWYLALLSLKSNNKDATRAYLEELQKGSDVFKNEVEALLKTLE